MMERYLIVKLKKDTDEKAMCEQISDLFSEAVKIDGVRKADVYVSNHDLKQRYDLMIRIRLNKKAVQDLEGSEFYRRWKQEYSEHIEKITVFDI